MNQQKIYEDRVYVKLTLDCVSKYDCVLVCTTLNNQVNMYTIFLRAVYFHE